MPEHSSRLLIVGAGPTGLGAAYRLAELGHASVRLIEREDRVGGLARSFTDAQGFTWDIGGHVLFSHYTYFDELFEKLMRGQYTLNNRESWVRTLGTWAPYPFQNNLRYLPEAEALECLLGLVRAQTGRGKVASAKDAANFGEFIDAVFGEGIARVFMRPYNFKVWAHPVEMLNKQWIGERVAVIDYERAIRNAVTRSDDFGWGPNNRFKYPLGGTGDFYDRFEPHVRDVLTLRTSVVAVDADRRVATLSDGSQAAYDLMLSTMPVDLLVARVIRSDVPKAVRDAAAALKHSAGHMVGIGVRRPCPSTRSWMYFAEDDCPFYRATYLSNYSPRMTPDPATHHSFLCEVSESVHKPVDGTRVVEDCVRGLESVGLLERGARADIVSTWHHRAEYSYPTPSVERDEILSVVIPWLEERGISSRGRFGMWKYEVSNTDHSVMQGVEWANRVLLGQPETTIGITYRVTEDGRRAAEHERPAYAGSGEKRIASQLEPRHAPPGGARSGTPSLVDHIGQEEVGAVGDRRSGS